MRTASLLVSPNSCKTNHPTRVEASRVPKRHLRRERVDAGSLAGAGRSGEDEVRHVACRMWVGGGGEGEGEIRGDKCC